MDKMALCLDALTTLSADDLSSLQLVFDNVSPLVVSPSACCFDDVPQCLDVGDRLAPQSPPASVALLTASSVSYVARTEVSHAASCLLPPPQRPEPPPPEKTVHKAPHAQTAEITQTAPFSCTDCERVFRRLASLQAHRRHCTAGVKISTGQSPVSPHPLSTASPTLPAVSCDLPSTTTTSLLSPTATTVVEFIVSGESISTTDAASRTPTAVNEQSTAAKQQSPRLGSVTCEVCGKLLASGAVLRRHMLIHSGARPYKCTACRATFNQSGALAAHVASLHATARRFQCDVCGRRFALRTNLTAHVRRVHAPGHRRQKRQQCGTTSTTNAAAGPSQWWNEARVTALLRALMTCWRDNTQRLAGVVRDVWLGGCVRPVVMRRALLQLKHQPDIDTTRDDDEPDVEQPAAGGESDAGRRTMTTISDVNTGRKHLVRVLYEPVTEPSRPSADVSGRRRQYAVRRVLQCLFCERRLVKLVDMVRHMRRHYADRPFACRQCGRRFRLRQTALKHQRHAHPLPQPPTMSPSAATVQQASASTSTSTSVAEVQCSYCVRQFGSVRQCRAHIQRCHSAGGSEDRGVDVAARRFACGQCPASFKQRGHLTTHLRLHSGERPHACRLCPRRFTTSSALNAHQATHKHTAATRPAESSDGGGTNQCPVCGARLATAASLRRHMSTHSHARPFVCRTCGGRFKTRAVCERHERCMHTTVVSVAATADTSVATEASTAETGATDVPPANSPHESVLESNAASTQHAVATHEAVSIADKGAAHQDDEEEDVMCQLRRDYAQCLVSELASDSALLRDASLSASSPLPPPPPPSMSLLRRPVELTVQQSTQLACLPLTSASSPGQSCLVRSAMERVSHNSSTAGTGGQASCSLPAAVVALNSSCGGSAIDGRHACVTCGKRFQKPSDLRRHTRVHTGERPFSCELCGRCFSLQSTLATHQRVHTGERRFSCAVCAAAFKSKCSLMAHTRIHTGARPYTCDLCDSAFRTAGQLRVHERCVHKLVLPGRRDCGVSTHNTTSAAESDGVSGAATVHVWVEQRPSRRSESTGAGRVRQHRQLPTAAAAASNAQDALYAASLLTDASMSGHNNDSNASHLSAISSGGAHTAASGIIINTASVDSLATLISRDNDAGGVNAFCARDMTAQLPPSPPHSLTNASVNDTLAVDAEGQTYSLTVSCVDSGGVSDSLAGGDMVSNIAPVQLHMQADGHLTGLEQLVNWTATGDQLVECPREGATVVSTADCGQQQLQTTHAAAGLPERRRHACSQCSRTFNRRSLLERHMRHHTGERPFACVLCGRRFTQTNALQTHMRMHRGERPYSCPHCGDAFSQRGNMRTHIRRVHPAAAACG